MRLDGLTLLELSKEIDYSCSGMRVDRISSVGPWAVLFGMQDGSGILVSSSPKGARAVVTEAKAPVRSDASGFVMVLRKHLEGGRLVKALKRPLENSLSLCFRGWDD
ncbi:MAG TPA: NFACT family protein, partial [Bacillota bacterium]|nr:NFACT family protein [Bacillota bacterium]